MIIINLKNIIIYGNQIKKMRRSNSNSNSNINSSSMSIQA